MRLDTHLSQRMDQRMILAPRMIQSMEILQLPIMALQERIQQELQENPVLEQKEVPNDETTPNEETDGQVTEDALEILTVRLGYASGTSAGHSALPLGRVLGGRRCGARRLP